MKSTYTPIVNSSDSLAIAMGLVAGTSHVNKFGRNPTVASGATEDIWDGSALYSFPATALMTSISQTTDQAALRSGIIEVQGLDANYALVTQNATLNASDTTTVVTLTTPLIRCFRMRVLANVVTTSSVRVHNAGETQDYAIISTGLNQTRMAIYTVPASKTAYITNYYATVSSGGGAPTSLQIRLWARDNANNYERQIRHSLGLNANTGAYGRFQHFFTPYLKVTQKTDIYIDATTAGGTADVSAGFDLILVDN